MGIGKEVGSYLVGKTIPMGLGSFIVPSKIQNIEDNINMVRGNMGNLNGARRGEWAPQLNKNAAKNGPKRSKISLSDLDAIVNNSNLSDGEKINSLHMHAQEQHARADHNFNFANDPIAQAKAKRREAKKNIPIEVQKAKAIEQARLDVAHENHQRSLINRSNEAKVLENVKHTVAGEHAPTTKATVKHGLTQGLTTVAVGLGAAGAAYGVKKLWDNHKSEQTWKSLQETHPELTSSKKDRDNFEILKQYSPALAANKDVAQTYLTRIKHTGMVPHEFVKDLISMQSNADGSKDTMNFVRSNAYKAK